MTNIKQIMLKQRMKKVFDREKEEEEKEEEEIGVNRIPVGLIAA